MGLFNLLGRLFSKKKDTGMDAAQISPVPKEQIPDEEQKPPKPYSSLGDGYYLAYQEADNRLGGIHEVNLCLYKGTELIRRMTDDEGRFLDFPGVIDGKWKADYTFAYFEPVTRFPFSCAAFGEDGLADFVWKIQPDGLYWADEDGYGVEPDREIDLYAKFDKTGKFIEPFHEKKDD